MRKSAYTTLEINKNRPNLNRSRISLRQDPTSDGVLAEMQILDAESSDAGAYFCQASNLYGKEQQLVNLHVQGIAH